MSCLQLYDWMCVWLTGGQTVGKMALGLQVCILPAPSGANKKPFPRGAPMQHLVLCRNPERNPERLTALDWVLYLTFSENMTRVLAHPHLLFAHGI